MKSRSREEPLSAVTGGSRRLAVAVIGCGRIAAHHLRFIAGSRQAVLVGLADVDQAAAERLGAGLGVNVHSSVEALLDATRVDVLHVTTPPALHFTHAMAAIERGVSVLVEKPIAMTHGEVECLYSRAAQRRVFICPDYIQIFHPKMQQALALIGSGALGRVVHVVAHLGTDADLGAMRESPGRHWSWDLPGGILRDYLTHPLYLALQFTGEPKRISVAATSHGVLPQSLTDHITVLIDGEVCTANVVLSMATRPHRYYVEVFCESGIVFVDFESMNLTVRRLARGPRKLTRATSDLALALQLVRGTIGTAVGYARQRVVPYQGLQALLNLYYSALLEAREPPVSQALAMMTTRAEETIFALAGRTHLDTSVRPSRQPGVYRAYAVLVTGATGYLGRELCRQLVKDGVRVRALVRPLSAIEPLETLGVELAFGDIRDATTVRRAAEGTDAVVHLAAMLSGSAEAILDAGARWTKNVADAARDVGCRRIIYVSSLSIYDFATLRDGDTIDEQSPLEAHPEQRGIATQGKCRAEAIALAHVNDLSPAWTILRPSLIVGNGSDVYRPVGYKVGGVLLGIGSPRMNLKLIHVSDVAGAIRAALEDDASKGRVFTLSDGRSLTAGEYVDRCIEKGSVRVVYVPYWLARTAQASFGALHALTGRGPRVHLRRLKYLYRDAKADSGRFTEATGWRPKGDLLQRIAREAQSRDSRAPLSAWQPAAPEWRADLTETLIPAVETSLQNLTPSRVQRDEL